MNEKQYIKGFNSGYSIKRYSPELYDKLSKAMETNSEYLGGFKDGGQQRIHEEKKLGKSEDQIIDIDKSGFVDKTPDKEKDREINK